MSAQYPLTGVRVLDLSRVLAGPYVGRMLSDLGADVVKIEPPEGDVARNWGRVVQGLSGYYTQQNAGKRNISIDLRQAGAPQLVRRLAERSDILVENFRPGVLAQYGLGYAELAQLNPRLVMLSISGYGQRGPRAEQPAYASVMHAETGLMRRQADVYGTRPRDVPISVADMNAGLHGLSAVLAALYMRERCGHGQHIDIAMTDTMLATDDHVHLALDGEQTERPFAVDVWDVAFGHIVIAGDFRWIFRQLVECSGLVDPTPPQASLSLKIELRRSALQAFLLAFPDAALLGAALDKANLAWGQVQSTSAALNSETARWRGSVVEVADRAGGKRRVIQSPYRFSAAVSGLRGPAPFRGEHNAVVLREWLGAGDAEIEQLRTARVLLEEAALSAAES